MPLLAFKPVGRSSLDMSGRSTGRDAWNCAVKRSLGAWMKLEVILGCVMGRAEQRGLYGAIAFSQYNRLEIVTSA
jgi:hypothetical protein